MKSKKPSITVDDLRLWVCTKEVPAKKCEGLKDPIRRMLIEENEIVEFRYHCDIHFRTIDDIYCVLDEDTFYKHFKPYGDIYEQVRFGNRCKLKDILEHHLYDDYEHIKCKWKDRE